MGRKERWRPLGQGRQGPPPPPSPGGSEQTPKREHRGWESRFKSQPGCFPAANLCARLSHSVPGFLKIRGASYLPLSSDHRVSEKPDWEERQ